MLDCISMSERSGDLKQCIHRGDAKNAKGQVQNGTCLSSNVGWVSVFCVTHQVLRSNATRFFNVCLPAHPVGYGANDAPNPPYIDDETA